MAPRRVAALAVCLLAMAAGAAAQPPSCTAGSFTMELVDANSTLLNNEVAKCLPSATVGVDVSCNVYITTTASDSAYVESMWTTTAAGIDTYKEFKLCPAASTANVTAASNAGVPAAFLLALNSYVYGLNSARTVALKSSGYGQIQFTHPGRVRVQYSNGPDALIYAIRTVIGTPAFDSDNVIAVTNDTGFVTGQVVTTNLGEPCGAGRYGLEFDNGKLCAVCPAGTTGVGGFSCKSCPAGSASDSVLFSGSCTQCPAGTYAPEGSSNCLPCPTHTYSAANKGECTACPEDTYAWLPGSTECVRCAAGVAYAHTAISPPAASEGNAILRFSTTMSNCALQDLGGTNGDYSIPMYRHCSSWKNGTTNPLALKLSLAVAEDCSVVIRPIGDTACADFGAANGATRLTPLTGPYGYNYNELKIQAYYTAPGKIRTLLPSNATGSTGSSFMLNIIPSGSAGVVRLQMYPATTKPADSAIANFATTTCVTDADIDGSSVAGLPATPQACGAGSYSNGTFNGCKPCPQGQTCTSGVATDCAADTANPYLGQSQAGACLACTPATSGYTSAAGSPYCTIPWWDKMCTTNHGEEWNEFENKCMQCRPGTFRDGTSPNPECQECPAGQYSGWGAQQCTNCPAGQYNPTSGMGDQTLVNSTTVCLRCPRGSIALLSTEIIATGALVTSGSGDFRNESTLSAGATTCDACPSGTWANPTNTEAASGAKGCTLCPTGTYRSGDAAPENNICRNIPPGYKASATLQTTPTKIGATDITPCEKGKFANWLGASGARVPADATMCQDCAAGYVAPRTGMAQCNLCQGGYYRTAADATVCRECSSGSYRTYLDASNACQTCPAGWEVGNTPRTSCTKCAKGFFKTVAGTNDTCTACPLNKFQNKIGATSDCTWCPAGKETRDTGNSECTPCAVGYYNPVTAAQSTTPACIAAPAGTFVNVTGATIATLCPLGTYNPDTAQDACEPCAPGQYANTRGNAACKTCPAGTASGARASTCRVCPAGFSALAGSGSCSPCKPGTYAGSARSDTCKLCPRGAQCPTPATVTPRLCPAGSFSAKDGAVLCTPCPVNTFAASTGSKQCTRCAAGFNTRGLPGQKICQPVRITPTGLRRSKL